MPTSSALTRYGAPRPLLVAAGVVLLQGVAAAGYGVAELLHLNKDRPVVALTVSAFFLILGAGLAFCAWALTRVRAGVRGPVLLAQLISLGLAWNFGSGGTWTASVAFAVPAAIALVGMLHPATIAALEGARGSDED